MIKYENHCCDCAVPGYPCIGSSCPYVNVPVYYCDICDNDTYAICDIDGTHYCQYHAQDYVKEIFDNLTIFEKAEVLDISCKELEE